MRKPIYLFEGDMRSYVENSDEGYTWEAGYGDGENTEIDGSGYGCLDGEEDGYGLLDGTADAHGCGDGYLSGAGWGQDLEDFFVVDGDGEEVS